MGITDVDSNIIPFHFADIVLCEGPQRSGKSCSAIAKMVGAVLKRVAEIFLKSRGINADVLSCRNMVKVLSGGNGRVVVKSVGREATIRRNGLKESIQIPRDFPLVTEIKVFANFHVYGIPYKFLTFAQIIQGLADGTICDGWLLIDQAEIGGDAREGMKAAVKTLTKYSNQFGKRHLHVIMIYPHAKIADWRFRFNFSEEISCKYNPRTQEITIWTHKKGDKRQRPPVTYWAPQYWPFYDTDETIDLSNNEVLAAVESAS